MHDGNLELPCGNHMVAPALLVRVSMHLENGAVAWRPLVVLASSSLLTSLTIGGV